MSDILFAPRAKGKLRILSCRPLLPTAVPEPLTLRLLMSRLAQCFRLMVGVQDYPAYLRHMQQRHPQSIPMNEKEFHRYCLDARFPSAAGKIGKCPC